MTFPQNCYSIQGSVESKIFKYPRLLLVILELVKIGKSTFWSFKVLNPTRPVHGWKYLVSFWRIRDKISNSKILEPMTFRIWKLTNVQM